MELESLAQEYGFLLASTLLTATLAFSLFTWWQRGSSSTLPPGSFGFWPLLGESLVFIRLFRSGNLQEFIRTRQAKHGSVFKTSLFGCCTLVDVNGPSLNKFLFSNENKLVIDKWPNPVIKLMGKDSVFSIHGAAHKRMRAAFSSFLGPAALPKSVHSIEVLVLEFFAAHFDARPGCEDKKAHVCIYPLMKKFAFSLASSFLLSLYDPASIARLYPSFSAVLKGVFSLPVNLPGTRFHAATIGRKALDHELQLLLDKRRLDLIEGLASPDQDGLSCLITETDAEGKALLSDVQIRSNLVALLTAAHETTASVLTMMFKFLVENPAHFQVVKQEHDEIASTKPLGEALTWHDVQTMKYSWKFIKETMRISPPVEFALREALEEFDYDGYKIPKGWKVLLMPFSSHMKSEVFSEPHLFNPLRFKGSGPPPFSFVPFGGGVRLCPGMEFARMSVLVFLHHLVRKYQWKLANPDEPMVSDPTSRPKQGLPVKITPLP